MDWTCWQTLRKTRPLRASGWSTTSTAEGSWVLSDLRTPPTTSSLLPPAPSSKHLQTFVLMRRKHKRGYKKKAILSGHYKTVASGRSLTITLPSAIGIITSTIPADLSWQNTAPFHDKNITSSWQRHANILLWQKHISFPFNGKTMDPFMSKSA